MGTGEWNPLPAFIDILQSLTHAPIIAKIDTRDGNGPVEIQSWALSNLWITSSPPLWLTVEKKILVIATDLCIKSTNQSHFQIYLVSAGRQT